MRLFKVETIGETKIKYFRDDMHLTITEKYYHPKKNATVIEKYDTIKEYKEAINEILND